MCCDVWEPHSPDKGQDLLFGKAFWRDILGIGAPTSPGRDPVGPVSLCGEAALMQRCSAVT